MFATTGGTVRRNKLSDFVDVRRSGIIAMKLDEGEAIVDVQICTERDDVLLTTARRPVHPLPGRRRCACSQGAIRWACAASRWPSDDKVISLAILRHVEATAEERAAYLRRASAVRRGGVEDEAGTEEEEASGAIELGEQRYVEMSAAEQFILTVSRERLRQAHLVVRVPHHRPRRQRHRRHGGERPQRQAGRLLPGGGERPDHAGDRRRPTDPLPGATASASPAARRRA